MTATLHRRMLLALVMALVGATIVVAPPAIAPAAASSDGSEDSTGSRSTETTTTLSSDSPHVSTSHDAGSGGWTFVVQGDKHVASVRISVAENDCANGGETLWDTKVSDDELESGPVAREVAFTEGAYCSHLLLDGNKNATATVTTSVPARPVACASPTADASPTPDASSSETAAPDASTSPTPEASSSPSTDPCEPYTSAEYDRCSDDTKVKHRVLAGATGPDPDAPFNYTKFYPSTLQVHQGDLVEWCFNGGYDWHTVSFSARDMDVSQHPEPVNDGDPVWRWDENGTLAIQEDFVFGPEGGDESLQCGRGPYWHLPPQPYCSVSETEPNTGSSLWDRFFATNSPTGSFRATIDLPPGVYRYRCRIHLSMNGYIEVLPAEQEVVNPTHAEVDAEIASDHEEAQELFDELSDASSAYDFDKRRWNVHVGATTADGAVEIYQFMPARIDVAKGDRVHYEVASFGHTVTFPGGRQFDGLTLPTGGSGGGVKDTRIEGIDESDLQGGNNARGRCGPHSCSGENSTGVPWGLIGLSFPFACDADDRASGSAVPLPYVPAAATRQSANAPTGTLPHGCVRGGLPEMYSAPWISAEQRAPADLVASEKTFHNSGMIFDPATPERFRSWVSDGLRPAGSFGTDFDASFPPTTGTFKYFCILHEFMNGVVNVIETR